MKWRITTILIAILALYGALYFNLYALQIKNGARYIAKAESRKQFSEASIAERGIIYLTDRAHNRIAAAINKEFPVIFAVPVEIHDPAGAARDLHETLGLDQNRLQKAFERPGDLYEELIAKASPEQITRVQSLATKGIYVENRNFRYYPFERLASHILGFVGPMDTGPGQSGRYGIERTFDEPLRDSRDVMLTIDRNIQARAETILGNLVRKFHGTGGAVIVEEPASGRILALANNPDFDPNTYSQFDIRSFSNPALQSLYEPGSVFKVITMAAGIDSRAITPDTTFYDAGSLTLNKKTIRNWDLKANGTITMTQVIERSVNTGAAFAERTMGHETFYEYLLKFGFKDTIGLPLPGEIAGRLTSLEKNPRDINFATASFGQGVAVTPLELIRAIAAIANGGVDIPPFIVENNHIPGRARRIIAATSAAQVTAMMASAVKKAEIAQIPHYEVAGKTGTAQVPDFVHGGYLDKFIHTYVGFAPASHPRFIILIKLDKPEGAPLAGITVVPAFRELAEFVLNYYNIPPDNLASIATP